MGIKTGCWTNTPLNRTPQLEEMVRQKITLGPYAFASELAHEVLRLMEEKDQERAAERE